MRYFKARWMHDSPDEAVLWYHEVDDDLRETRKVVVFRDGRMERADTREHTDYTELGTEPLPSLEEIDAQAEFEAAEIDELEFEQVWTAAAPPPRDREHVPGR
jgi:hypothetical protein